MGATYIIFLVVCNYLADWYVCNKYPTERNAHLIYPSYGPYASSALAGSSLLRESIYTCFPGITHSMLAALQEMGSQLCSLCLCPKCSNICHISGLGL